MKTRTALVSNSSSSSFICDRPIKEVALEMWSRIASDFDHMEQDDLNDTRRKIEELASREDVLRGQVGIAFPSINYDTYILIVDGKCIINTCNNHHFYDIDGLVGQSEEFSFDMLRDKFFYHASMKNNLIKLGSVTQYENQNTLRCPECQKHWGLQKETYCHSYYVADDGSKWCCDHFVQLVEVKPQN